MTHTHRAPLAVLMAVIMILTGCSTATVITDLELALDAISAALPVLLPLVDVPADAPVAAAVQTYLTAANSALGQASTILAGTGTDASKAAAILAAFAGIAAPVVPAQYGTLAAQVATVAQDIAAFLAFVPGTGVAGALRATAGGTHKWSAGERLKLAHARSAATSNGEKLAKMRVK